MKKDEMKKCPYCAEMIKKEAIKCRYCGSVLEKKEFNFDFLSTPGYWNRVNEGKKIAGVCTGIARQFDSPILILPLRLFFILTTVFYGFGIILYIILWLLMSEPTDIQGKKEKIHPGENTQPVSGNEQPEDTQDTKETEQPDTPVEKDAKMIRIFPGLTMLSVIVILPLLMYLFVLDNIFGLMTLSVIQISGLLFSGIILSGIIIVIYHNRFRGSLINVLSP